MKCDLCQKEVKELITSKLIPMDDVCEDCWDYLFNTDENKRIVKPQASELPSDAEKPKDVCSDGHKHEFIFYQLKEILRCVKCGTIR